MWLTNNPCLVILFGGGTRLVEKPAEDELLVNVKSTSGEVASERKVRYKEIANGECELESGVWF